MLSRRRFEEIQKSKMFWSVFRVLFGRSHWQRGGGEGHRGRGGEGGEGGAAAGSRLRQAPRSAPCPRPRGGGGEAPALSAPLPCQSRGRQSHFLASECLCSGGAARHMPRQSFVRDAPEDWKSMQWTRMANSAGGLKNDVMADPSAGRRVQESKVRRVS